MGVATDLRMLDYGDRALLLECESTAEVLAWTDTLRQADLLGVTDIVPASRTVLVKVDGARYLPLTRQRIEKLRPVPDDGIAAPGVPDMVIDVVYDGEQQRTEMYDWAVSHTNGFERRGSVRAFDNKYYTKEAVVGPISLRSPFHNAEFSYLVSVAEAELKIPVTGAYTIADWSFDERNRTPENLLQPAGDRARQRHAARRDFVLEVARNMIRPNLEALIKLGARWIQVDEPGASTEADELDLFVDSFNASVEGLNAMFSTHLCFSDYNLFFPAIERMEQCRQYAVGFANYDSRELGTTDEARPGYAVIKKFRDLSYKPALGLGVLDIHSDFIESPELVRDRVLYAVKVFGDPARIHVTPDCGLRTRSWTVAYEKLRNMTAGVRLARRELGVSTGA